jgi:4-amino-4-deoxy-L-arabinose transferase-like glycosyltransferase
MFLFAVAALSVRAGLDAGDAWWAAAFVAAMPAIYAGAHSGFVDVLYASFVLAAARIGLDAVRPKHFLAFGLFCGFAIATKYTGLLALPALLLTVGISAATSVGRQRRALIPSLGTAAAASLLVGAPAYVRNWLLLGCPIYPPPPLLASIFQVKYLSPEAVREFHSYIYQRGAGLGHGLSAFLLLPFRLTYHTANFHGAGGIGLYALALGPFGLIASRRNPFARALALLALLLTLEWFVTQQESRFLIHVYAIGVIFAVLGWHYVKLLSPRYGSVLCAVAIGCSLAYGFFMIGTARANDIAAALSSSFAERQRQQRIPFLESFRFLNSEPAVQEVLILDRSVPPYYCDRRYLKITGQWKEQVLPGIRDANDAIEHLGELHISHVLDVRSEVSDFQVPANTPRLRLVFERPNQRIYSVER